MAPGDSPLVLTIEDNCYLFRKILRQQEGLPDLTRVHIPDVQDLYDELWLLREERHRLWDQGENLWQKIRH